MVTTMHEDAIDTLQAFVDRHGGSNREGYTALVELAGKALYWAAGIRQDCEPDQSICEICLACRDATEHAHGLRVDVIGNAGVKHVKRSGDNPALIAEDVPSAKDPARSPWRPW
jgi:hypothetical protein